MRSRKRSALYAHLNQAASTLMNSAGYAGALDFLSEVAIMASRPTAKAKYPTKHGKPEKC